MSQRTSAPSLPDLSICIATYNRAKFLGETLESVMVQATQACEIVVLDGGSTDNTAQIVTEHARRFPRLRYIRQETNQGLDQDFDRVVQLAKGRYCWLMTDDDLLKPGAIQSVLSSINRGVSLVVVNVESRSLDLSEICQRRWLHLESDRRYGPEEMDSLFTDVGNVLTYIGGIVIKRSVWLSRERVRYYGSWFVHVAVIFQSPLPGSAVVLAEPLVTYRAGNTHTWSEHTAEIIFSKWPSLIQSLALSTVTKRRAHSADPWNHPRELLILRGLGHYTLDRYKQWVRPRLRHFRRWMPWLVALAPAGAVNTLLICYFSATGAIYRGMHADILLQFLKEHRAALRGP